MEISFVLKRLLHCNHVIIATSFILFMMQDFGIVNILLKMSIHTHTCVDQFCARPANSASNFLKLHVFHEGVNTHSCTIFKYIDLFGFYMLTNELSGY